MEKYILTIDSGTTSCRSLIVDKNGVVLHIEQQEFSQIFPKSGWVEHDPIEIWNTQHTTILNAKNKLGIKSNNIIAAGITNQRETIVLWDSITGLPIYNAIVWQDRRTESFCNELKQKGLEKKILDITGLVINPYFSASKIKWIIENVPKAKKLLKEKRLRAGTIDTWIIWKLTNGKNFVTDVSNASRTMLFNIHTQKWDDEMLEIFNISKEILPEVKSSADHFGFIEKSIFSQNATGEVPISSVIGDQQAALFGHLGIEEGIVKNTYGTGCFTLLNTGTTPIISNHKLLTTIAWKIKNEPTVYALEGSVFIGGAAIQWLRDALKIIYKADESDYYANLVKDEQKVFVVPSFTGLGAPYWDSFSRGAIFGLERNTKREHIIKSTLESIAFQSNDLIKAMEKDIKKPIKLLKVDGGAAQSKYLMQFQSSISNLFVEKPENIETTAMGATYLAGLSVGFWKNIDEIKKIISKVNYFEPKMDTKKRHELIKGWNESVKRTLNWLKDIE